MPLTLLELMMLSSVWTSSKPGADNKTLKTEKHNVRTDLCYKKVPYVSVLISQLRVGALESVL